MKRCLLNMRSVLPGMTGQSITDCEMQESYLLFMLCGMTGSAAATVMALDLAIKLDNDTGESIYDKRGIIFW